ncbi:MAG TPA: flagellar basal-body MS-ring/collar protein FliF [Phycisphaerae bacterium]|nr:flagellar basal-body MS-ring/collar protein FliF [Phycisphaerae bacterium]
MFQNVLEVWRRTRPMQRIVLVAVLLACAGAAALLVGWASQPEMALLYSNLAPEDAAKIVDKVRELGIAYEVKQGGSAVYVPVEEKYTVWLQLAGDGLPSGDNPGYRILDDEKIGAGPFTQRINYTRAMEGELAKTISLIEGILAARVHIVRPASNLFRQDEKGATATVALQVRPGWRLGPGSVAAIVHLVAHSVENLRAENVVVVDNTGHLLSGGADSPMARGAGTLFDYKSQVEEYLANKAESMLTKVLGPGRAIVRVDAVIETSSGNKTIETYDPEGKATQKEELTTKSETPAAPAAAAGQGPTGGASTEETVTTDYLVSRTVELTTTMAGKITSITVSAFVDLSNPEPAADTPAAGTAAPAAATPTEKLELADVKKIIQNALGLKEADGLTVVAVPFHQPETVAPEPEEASLFAGAQFYLDLARHASLGVLVIGALVVLRIFGRAKPRLAPAAGAGELEPGLGGRAMNLLGDGAAAPRELRQRITAALQENPEEVKRLFQTWVDEGQGET